MAEHGLHRHDLVWLASAAAHAAQPAGTCCAADPEARRLLVDWVAAGNPLVVTRQGSDCPPGQLRLGLALPPPSGKRRLAFTVASAGISHRAPALALSAATVEALPADWRPMLRTLVDTPALSAARPRVFGSAAMQVVTGEPCIGPESDIDLLFAPSDWKAAMAACIALARLDGHRQGPRIDGEIRNAIGDAVAWRELATDAPRLLVKGLREVRLIERNVWADGFRASAGIAA